MPLQKSFGYAIITICLFFGFVLGRYAQYLPRGVLSHVSRDFRLEAEHILGQELAGKYWVFGKDGLWKQYLQWVAKINTKARWVQSNIDRMAA
eukprot:5332143-Amphidinium_carterae.1